MAELMTNPAPFAAILFIAACALWLVWRAIRSLFASPRARRNAAAPQAPDPARRDPALSQMNQPSTSVPDAADILALKASIDALARQIALLEKRLAPANLTAVATPARQAPTVELEAARGTPIPEVPLVVPDHRI